MKTSMSRLVTFTVAALLLDLGLVAPAMAASGGGATSVRVTVVRNSGIQIAASSASSTGFTYASNGSNSESETQFRPLGNGAPRAWVRLADDPRGGFGRTSSSWQRPVVEVTVFEP